MFIHPKYWGLSWTKKKAPKFIEAKSPKLQTKFCPWIVVFNSSSIFFVFLKFKQIDASVKYIIFGKQTTKRWVFLSHPLHFHRNKRKLRNFYIKKTLGEKNLTCCSEEKTSLQRWKIVCNFFFFWNFSLLFPSLVNALPVLFVKKLFCLDLAARFPTNTLVIQRVSSREEFICFCYPLPVSWRNGIAQDGCFIVAPLTPSCHCLVSWAGFCMAADAVAKQRGALTPAHGLVVVTSHRVDPLGHLFCSCCCSTSHVPPLKGGIPWRKSPRRKEILPPPPRSSHLILRT